MASEAFHKIRDLVASKPIPTEIKANRAFLDAGARPLVKGVKGTLINASGVTAEMQIPEGAASDAVILYFHGGGYVGGSIASHRNLTGNLALASKCQLLSVEYRLAPENPHPAAVEDALNSYKWLLSEGYDPKKIAISGDSAGGGLAIAVQLKIRDEGLPLPVASAPISPWIDMGLSGDTMSSRQSRDPLIRLDLIREFKSQFLGPINNSNDPYASPLQADLSGLPPMLIHVGDDEMLLSDSERLAEKASAAGVSVTLEIWPEMIHVWHTFVGLFPEAQDGINRIAEFFSIHLEI
ncbi:MAG TPA: alpha/beta hydrolase [Acidimicrobiaceae bacterium]|jgi:acetyl esterase/lipase|nr:alpha/beta hydrolase [Actinomycetota bacterium]HAN08457.1 alpha/beta hydrolase [Acidimicrobiaceae bacterium]